MSSRYIDSSGENTRLHYVSGCRQSGTEEMHGNYCSLYKDCLYVAENVLRQKSF